MYALGIMFKDSAAIKKKVIQDFHFSDLRAGGTKRAGDVTVEQFENKVDQTLYKINTYHSPHVNHAAWK